MRSPIDLTLIGSDDEASKSARSSKRLAMQKGKGVSDHLRPSIGSIISIGSDSDVKERDSAHAKRRRTRKSSLDLIEDPNEPPHASFHGIQNPGNPPLYHPAISNTTSMALKSLLMGAKNSNQGGVALGAERRNVKSVLAASSGDVELIGEVNQSNRQEGEEDQQQGGRRRRRSSQRANMTSPLPPLTEHEEYLGLFNFSPLPADGGLRGEDMDKDGGLGGLSSFGSEERGSGVKRRPRRASRTSLRGGLSSPFSMSQLDDYEEDSLIPEASPVAAKKARRGKKTEEEKQIEAEEKARQKEEKKRSKEREKEEKKVAVEAAKIEKKATTLAQKALRGTDGEARIRVKVSTKAAVCNWYGAALSSINTLLSLPTNSNLATTPGAVSVSPTLPLGSELSIVTWSRMMPQVAAEALILRGGSGGAAKEGATRVGVGLMDAEVEVIVPMILLAMSPEDLVAQVERDKLEGLMERVGRHYPDCSLLIASCGLDSYLAKKQARTPGFNIKLIEDFILDVIVSPSSTALHLRLDLKDEAHLATFIGEETRVIARDLQRSHDGFLASFTRKGEGLDNTLPRGEHDESTRTLAKALTQNCLLPLDKAATVAVRFKSLGGLLDAYSDPTKTEKQKKELLMGSNLSGTKNLGIASSTAVYSLLSSKRGDDLVHRVG